ncbi:MAG: hypothetical protein NTY65_17520 [Planctomycetota bacterium]|nr:hypothetical protein [Planctomycetota bacterium]
MRHNPRARKRRCTRCGEVRLLEEFPPQKETRDGRGSICRSCRRRMARAYRRLNQEHYRRIARESHSQHCFPGKFAARSPEETAKRRSRNLAERALKAGRLRRPDRCQACGEPAGSTLRIEMHHPDYARPLDVRFLCTFCHGREHQRFADDLPDPWENGLGRTIADCELPAAQIACAEARLI